MRLGFLRVIRNNSNNDGLLLYKNKNHQSSNEQKITNYRRNYITTLSRQECKETNIFSLLNNNRYLYFHRCRQHLHKVNTSRHFSKDATNMIHSSKDNNNSSYDRTFFLSCFWRSLSVISIIHCLSQYVIQVRQCNEEESSDMISTKSRDILLIDRLAPRLYGIEGNHIAEERIHLARAKQEIHNKNTNNNNTWHESYYDDNKKRKDLSNGRMYNDDKSNKINTRKIDFKLFQPVSIGDIVLLKNPRKQNDKRNILARVLGLPGDQVMIPTSNNNNDYYNRDRSIRKGRFHHKIVTIPDGHIWVEKEYNDDRRVKTLDSRSYGPIPASLIIGRPILCLWASQRHSSAGLSIAAALFGGFDAPNPGRGTIILPAGYQGETISWENDNKRSEN